MQGFLFLLFLLFYLVTMTGNLSMIILIRIDSRLHTPMYFFLSHLSFADVCFSSVVGPKMLRDFFAERKAISFLGCALQQWFFGFFVAIECLLLASMAYDRYMAICEPLHYTTTMNNRVCTALILCCWLAGLLIILPPLGMGLQLEFCDSNVIDHFVCDTSPILQITCSDTVLIETISLSFALLTLIFTLLCVVLSYTYIIKTILRFPSAQQRQKAFSTCSSHIIVVSITYGSCIFIYIKPSAKEGVAFNKVVSVLTTSVAPLLNPFIYTLRNKQVKEAFKDTIKQVVFLTKK